MLVKLSTKHGVTKGVSLIFEEVGKLEFDILMYCQPMLVFPMAWQNPQSLADSFVKWLNV